jgi:hypothetical protein
MAVITASSLFLVMLSVGAVQDSEEDMDLDGLLDQLQEQGLWPQGDEELDVEGLEGRFASLVIPDGVNGIHLRYRVMGEPTPLASYGTVPPENAEVCSERAPTLMRYEGRAVPAMAEVLAW